MFWWVDKSTANQHRLFSDKSDSQGDVKIDGEMTPVVMNNDNSNNSRKLEPKLPPYKDANINMLLSPDLKMSESSSSLFSYADMEDSDLDLHKLNDSHSQQMELNRYEQLVNINLTSLALISEHLHNLLHVKQTRNQQYKWSQFTLISQLPLLVTEYAAFYSATSTQLGLQVI